MPDAVLAPVQATFRAVAAVVVPDAASLDAAGWTRAEALIEDALARRDPRQHRQLRLFLRVLDTAARLRWARPFHRLDAERRSALLHRFERAPVLALRRGVWGVRTLAFLGWYGLPEVRRAIGYRPDPRGWEARRA